jgi:hypothetical protein
MVVALDVSQFQASKERAQARVDQIALQAARLLPDSQRATSYVLEEVSQDAELVLSEPIEMSADRVSLVLEGQVDSVFDFLLEIAGSESQVFSFKEASTAIRVPQDIVIILPDDNSLRPRARTVWGAETEWPASRYFNFITAPTIQGLEPQESEVYWSEWWKDFGDNEFRRWATQSCFNPVYSAIKSSAISLIDMYQASDNNRLGVLFTPGDDELLGYSEAQALGFPGQNVRWANYWEPQSYLSDEACVLFSDEQESDDPRYRIFKHAAFGDDKSKESQCSSIIEKRTWGQLYYPYGNLSSCYLADELDVREAVYYRAVRDTAHRADSSNVFEALREALAQQQQSNESIEAELLRRRGNLYVSPVRRVILFADAFPDISADELERQVASIVASGREVQIDLVFFSHQGLSVRQENALTKVVANLQSRSIPNIAVYFAADSTALVDEVLPEVIAKNAEVVIRK